MAENINDISFSPQMLAMFYGRTLVDIPPASPETAIQQLKFLGSNKRNITILVHDPEQTHLAEQELNVLTKMLDACRVNIGDVAIINLARQTTSEENLFRQLNPVKIIDFGTNATRQSLSIESLTGYELLTAPSLKELTADNAGAKQMKVKLWGLLKQFFGL